MGPMEYILIISLSVNIFCVLFIARLLTIVTMLRSLVSEMFDHIVQEITNEQ